MGRTVLIMDGSASFDNNKASIKYVNEEAGTVTGAVITGTPEEKEIPLYREKLGVPVIYEEDLNSIERLKKGLEKFRPEKIYDLTGSPVVSRENRDEFAGIIVKAGVYYEGLDFSFSPSRPDTPLIRDFILHRPSTTTLAILTAGEAHNFVINSLGKKLARYKPLFISMKKNGPLKPEVISFKSKPEAKDIVKYYKEEGSLSDSFQTVLATGFPLIESFRVGEAYRTGVAAFSNIWTATQKGEEFERELIIYNGDGICRPPVKLHGEILIVNAKGEPENLGKTERYSIIKADMIVITGCEPPYCSRDKLKKWRNVINSLVSTHLVMETIVRPEPENHNINGKNLFLFTHTEEDIIIEKEINYLEEKYNCHVAAYSNKAEDIEEKTSNLDFNVFLIDHGKDTASAIKKADKNKEIILYEKELISCDGKDLYRSLKEVARLAYARNNNYRA